MHFIKANYHTHTWRCKHAKGTEREYIEAAIASGIEILGFSDHVPCRFPGDYVSGIRMSPDQTDGYMQCLRTLAEEYKDDITIYIGFEAEYIPAYFDYHRSLIDEEGFDYLIMGQHFLDLGGEEGQYAGMPTDDVTFLNRYVELVIEGADTGYFKYVAHPDLMNFIGDEALYEEKMQYMCEKLKSLGIPLEINVLGLATGRHYPSERFFKIAAKAGNDIIMGMDAHSVDNLTDRASYEKALSFADGLGLHLIEEIDI